MSRNSISDIESTYQNNRDLPYVGKLFDDENYTFKERILAAFAKMFHAEGYDPNAKKFNDYFYSEYDQLSEELREEAKKIIETGAEHFVNFLNDPSLDNPSVSFFGFSGLEEESFIEALYLIKVPLTIIINVLRVLTEGILYIFELCFEHLQILSAREYEKAENNSDYTRQFLFGMGIILGALACYLFKIPRLAIRLILAPEDSFNAAWNINGLLGITSCISSTTEAGSIISLFIIPSILSGILTTVAYSVLPVIIVPAFLSLFSSLFCTSGVKIKNPGELHTPSFKIRFFSAISDSIDEIKDSAQNAFSAISDSADEINKSIQESRIAKILDAWSI